MHQMKTLLFICFFMVLFLNISAQDSFLKTYGGVGTQAGNCVRQTSDGGYIIAAYSSVDYNSDAYLIKTDAKGDTLWTRKYGGAHDQEASCIQIVDNGYVFSGLNWVNVEEFQTYLVETDVNGNPSWEKVTSLGLNSSGNDLELTMDGGYATIGSYSFYPELQTMTFLKFDDQGDMVLEQTLNYSYGSEYGNSLVALDADQGSGYAVLASIAFNESSETGDDMFLVRLDENGDSLWTKKYGGVNDERGLCVQSTPGNGFILAGSSNSFGNGNWNAFLVKTDSEGNMEWMQNYGGDKDAYASHVHNTVDGGFVLTGHIDNGYPSDDDIYIVRTNSNGDTIWTRSVAIGKYDRGRWIEQTSDGGYILTGYSDLPTGDEYEVCLVKLNSNGIVLGNDEAKTAISEVNVYQNPLRQTLTLNYELKAKSTVSISLFNTSGQKLVSFINEKQDSGLKEMTLSTKGLLPGVYIGSITVNKVPSSFKLILY